MTRNFEEKSQNTELTRSSGNLRLVAKWAILGVVVQVVVYCVGIISLGAGHGSTKISKFLFPVPQLFGGLLSERYNIVAWQLEFSQYVLYFLFIGIMSWRHLIRLGVAIVVAIHLITYVIAR